MKACFLLGAEPPHGGLLLATTRLASALAESGWACEIVLPTTPKDAGPYGAIPVRLAPTLPAADEPLRERDQLSRELAASGPDLIVVAHGRPDLLSAAARVAPTVLHSHVHWGTCPEATRYWGRLRQECHVTAGWKCLALRPVLGCGSRHSFLSTAAIARRQRLVECLTNDRVGVIALSDAQAQAVQRHDIGTEMVSVIPNLGMRLTEDALRRASVETPIAERSAVVYVGRLSKDKGAHLLPELGARLGERKLLVFGEGYLEPRLRRLIPASVRGYVGQRRLAGVLQWADAAVFPSLWPEPGGIVGIDAQLFGIPLGAFSVGAPREWPGATLFAPSDVERMGAWLRSLHSRIAPRRPEVVADSQASFWYAVAEHAAGQLSAFADRGEFGERPLGIVRTILALARPKEEPVPEPRT